MATYHRNRDARQTQNEILQYLQGGNEATLQSIARALQLHSATVRAHLGSLENMGMVTLEQIPTIGIVAALTDEGAEWRLPQPPKPVELLPCGHPKTNLSFCLTCHNIERRQYCRDNKYLPTLRVQMR